MIENYEIRLLSNLMYYPNLMQKYYTYDDLFSNYKHRRIYKVIKSLYAKGIQPDIAIIKDHDNTIDSSTLALISEQYSAANSDFYYNYLVNASKLKKISLLNKTLTDYLETSKSADEIIYDLSKGISDISKVSNLDKIIHINDTAIEWIKMVEDRYKLKGALPGITTGFDTLDSYTLGLQKKQMIVVGARPSDGKTALMLNMALSAAKDGKKVFIVNLESNNSEMLTRLVSQTAMINGNKLLTGKLKINDFDRVNHACGILSETNIYFYDHPNISIDQIISKSRQAVSMHKCEVIYIDYIQIIKNTESFGTKREKLEDVSIKLKQLARELNVPIVIMSQLNRNAANKVPQSSEFKETGQIEQDADISILLYHEKESTKEETMPKIKQSWFIVDKSRNGQKGWIKVKFKCEYVKFTEE